MAAVFKNAPNTFSFPESELETLRFWKEQDIFGKSLALRKNAPTWVFYEGPPTANGKPHHGHVLTRTIKDIFLRYRTMSGFSVPRRAGWDCHGLPVEVEVEKELQAEGAVTAEGKEAIEEYGVEPFVRRCMDSVFKYTKEWEELTERIGLWLDMDKAYATYTTEYVESVWSALATIYDKGLLERGHKSLPWCPRCVTGLSSHEVGQGYKMVEDQSVFVAFPTKADPKTLLLAWTTTPWTLPSNLALAIREDATYVRVKAGDETLIMAESLVAVAMGDTPYEITGTLPGKELIGTEYTPLYDWAGPQKGAYRVWAADFVSTAIKTEEGEDGKTYDVPSTGIVHIAPGYGQDDYDLGQKNGLPIVTLMQPNGRFGDGCGFASGMGLKEASKAIRQDLKERQLLLRVQPHHHRYPHCWRCDTPLFYLARGGWFIRTTKVIDQIIKHNDGINWFPDHIKKGRFGKMLESNIDWAISRERYWGTPLPIWQCEKCGFEEAHKNKGSLQGRNPAAFDEFTERRIQDSSISEHMAVHKPFIDNVTYRCPKCSSTCRRVSEVIDCWFDSGCMPFAQWGYPHIGEEEFKNAFPADFITEAIDQTRGWFYSMLTIGTLVYGQSPFKNCLVMGHVGDEKGRKLSKHLKNYTPLDAKGNAFEVFGADAVRWFFAAGQPQWNNVRFFDDAIRNGQREFLIKICNVLKFFTTYANIDGFNPAENNENASSPDALADGALYRLSPERTALDRYVLAELAIAVRAVNDSLNGYDIYAASGALTEFVETLSNWYVRRSRDRFWSGEMTQDKADGHWTLYECLLTLTRLIAPITPFLAEQLYANLVKGPFKNMPESVHLCDFPEPDETAEDEALLKEMQLVREVVALGGSARAESKIKRRQPLSTLTVILARPELEQTLAAHAGLIADELSVKEVLFATDADQYVTYEIRPNFRAMGPLFGKKIPAVKKALSQLDAASARRDLSENGRLQLDVDGESVELTSDLVEVRLQAREGYAAAQGRVAVVVLNTDITEELALEALAREMIRAIQSERASQDMAYTDRIDVTISSAGPRVEQALTNHGVMIERETLARSVMIMTGVPSGEGARELTLEGETVMMEVSKAEA